MARKHPVEQPRAASAALQIDTDSFIPYYQQIVEQIRALIKNETLREGEVFRSEGDLAAALGISKMPVRQAFQKLRAEGLLVVVKGKVPVIGSSQVPWNFQELRGFTEGNAAARLEAVGESVEPETPGRGPGNRGGRCVWRAGNPFSSCGASDTSTRSPSHWSPVSCQ
jgi:DNA-binding transcriptional regulator YhcF (GntR family)